MSIFNLAMHIIIQPLKAAIEGDVQCVNPIREQFVVI